MDNSPQHNMGGRKRSLDDDDQSGKRKKNREAAQRCREKKLQETNDLKQRNVELQMKNDDLKQKKANLEEKLQMCIHEINQHKLSGCQLPVNIQTIMEQVQKMNPDFMPVAIQERPRAEPQITVSGLFTGSQVSPIDNKSRQRTRNPSSRSITPSPPPSVGSPTPQPLSTTKGITTNGNPRLSWSNLHNAQTLTDQMSPGLSPAQTVPNIDTDSLHQSNGFPSVDDAVKMAIKSSGVTPDTNLTQTNGRRFDNMNMYTLQSQASINSLGFDTQLSPVDGGTIPMSVQQEDQSRMDEGIQMIQPNNLYPPNSNMTNVTQTISPVSMNYTAELLSQAINSNFEPSEIEMSEDLKRQFVRLTSSDTSSNQPQPAVSCSFTTDQPFMQVANNMNLPGESSVNNVPPSDNVPPSNNIPPSNIPVGDNQNISYHGLLEMAKKHPKITVQYQGKDYQCTYEALTKLVDSFKNKNRVMYIDNNDDNTNNNHVEQTTFFQPQTLEAVVNADNTIEQNTYYYFENNPDQIFTLYHDSHITQETQLGNMDVVGIETQLQSPDADHVQNTQLPTTVLSMIEGDGPSITSMIEGDGPSTATSSDLNLDSGNYAQNVTTLPSLTFEESELHPNIFLKKRNG